MQSLPVCYPMRPRCASRRVTSMPLQHRSPCECTRRRPACLVRCAPPCRIASTATMNAPWPISHGRIIACVCNCASTSDFAESPLPSPHLHQTLAHRGRSLGLTHATSRPAPRRSGRGPGWHSRCAPQRPLGPGGEPEHPAAPAPEAASPISAYTHAGLAVIRATCRRAARLSPYTLSRDPHPRSCLCLQGVSIAPYPACQRHAPWLPYRQSERHTCTDG